MRCKSRMSSFFKSCVSKFCRAKTSIKAILVILLSIMLIVSSVKITEYIGYVMLDSKTELATDEIKDAADRIYKQNMGFESSIYIFYVGEKRNADDALFNKVTPDILNKDNFYICTDGGGSWILRHFNPTEVTSAFECFLYFDGKKLPSKLIGILNYQNTGGQLHPNDNTTFIAINEFEQLCAEVNISGMSRRKAAEKLAAAWIEQTGYVKW